MFVKLAAPANTAISKDSNKNFKEIFFLTADLLGYKLITASDPVESCSQLGRRLNGGDAICVVGLVHLFSLPLLLTSNH